MVFKALKRCRQAGLRGSLGSALLTLWRLTGILASVNAWLTIAISAYLNPWFSIWRHAFSDLGAPRASMPWVYNAGLVASGVLGCLFSLYLLHTARSKVEGFSSSLLFVAGIFLALIGVFPSSTRPHTFVSTWFFVQIWMCFTSYAVAAHITGRKMLRNSLATISITGPLGALLVEILWKWPSVALLEAYGIVVVSIGVVHLTLEYRGRSVH